MKNKFGWYLIMLPVILLGSIGVCLAQDTTIRLKVEGEPALKDKLTVRDGSKVLLLGKGESLRLLLDPGVTVESKNPEVVVVAGNSTLVGVTADAEVELVARRDGQQVKIVGVDKFLVRVVDADSLREVVAQATFLPYKNVKDFFGKKFAQSFFVVQVDIRNEKMTKQFIVQTVDVMIDPNQCRFGPELYAGFDRTECERIFHENFAYPSAMEGVRSEAVIAGGKADLNRSLHNVGFRALSFSAAMGSILTGFNGVLGPDGIKGMNVLGTTVTAAANALFPDSSAEKLDNLKASTMKEDVIIKSKESKTFNVFIPTKQVFHSGSWQKYIKPARDSDIADLKLNVVLDILLLSTATGVLVDNDAPKVEVKSDDQLRQQKEKFDIIVGEITEQDLTRAENYKVTINALDANLHSLTDDQRKKLTEIVLRLRERDLYFRAFLNSRETPTSAKAPAAGEADKAKKIADDIRALLRELQADNVNDNGPLIRQLHEIVITYGK